MLGRARQSALVEGCLGICQDILADLEAVKTQVDVIGKRTAGLVERLISERERENALSAVQCELENFKTQIILALGGLSDKQLRYPGNAISTSQEVPLAIVGEVMSHEHKIASLIHDALLSRGSTAKIQKLSLPLTGAQASGTWIIMLHRVPSRLDMDAILQQTALMPAMRTILVLLHNKDPNMRAGQHASAVDFKTDPASGDMLKSFAAVVEMYFQEKEWLECEQNKVSVGQIVGILCASEP